MTLLHPSDITAARCPRCGKRLEPDIGQHETYGDLRYRLVCWNDGYSEHGPANPEAARRRSPTVRSLAALLMAQRLEGTVVPLVYDTEPFPEEEW